MELWLNYKDEFGAARRVRADGENFVIGRTPDNDLSIARSELSRTHAEINRFDDVYVVADCNSSNGTTLNGRQLEHPTALGDGDCINLGGAIELTVEFGGRRSTAPDTGKSNAAIADFAAPDSANQSSEEPTVDVPEIAAAPVAANANHSAHAPKASSSSWKFLFIAAPVLVVVTLVLAGGLVLLLGNRQPEKVPINDGDDYIYSTDKNARDNRKTVAENKTPTPAKTVETANVDVTPANTSVTAAPTPAQPSGELDKVERGALSFVRRIAVRDDTYVFTQKQLGEINAQIKTFKGSAALRDNLKAVGRDRAKFEELAKSKGLKPQFLAIAALARIGNQTQNPLTVAQTMLPVLGELKITLGNELADENLLVIAAYDLGEQGKFRAMQSTLEALSKQTTGVASNKIRTIWYLRERGKITDAEYNFALRFLAIGAITQNPKDFGVEAEAVTFD